MKKYIIIVISNLYSSIQNVNFCIQNKNLSIIRISLTQFWIKILNNKNCCFDIYKNNEKIILKTQDPKIYLKSNYNEDFNKMNLNAINWNIENIENYRKINNNIYLKIKDQIEDLIIEITEFNENEYTGILKIKELEFLAKWSSKSEETIVEKFHNILNFSCSVLNNFSSKKITEETPLLENLSKKKN